MGSYFTIMYTFYIIGLESRNRMNKNNFYDLRVLILKYDLENYINNSTSFEVSFLDEKEHNILNKYLDDEESLELIREAVINVDDEKELDELIEKSKNELACHTSSDSELEQTIMNAFSFLRENLNSSNQRSKNLFHNSQILLNSKSKRNF